MDMIQGIKERRSIRRFKDMPVPRETLEEIVEAASYAPSWKNSQTVRYYIADRKELLDQIATEECLMGFRHNMNIIAGSPALVVLASVAGRSGYERDGSSSTAKGSHWESFDAGAAAMAFCLAAHEKGLGTVIMGIFDEDKVRQVIRLPEDQRISALISIGYPDEEPKVPPRKAPKELSDEGQHFTAPGHPVHLQRQLCQKEHRVVFAVKVIVHADGLALVRGDLLRHAQKRPRGEPVVHVAVAVHHPELLGEKNGLGHGASASLSSECRPGRSRAANCNI